jgi:hypothetical protein
MATHALPASHIVDVEDAPAAAHAPARQRSMLRRLYDAILQSQMRRAQIEIDRKFGSGALTRAFYPGLPPER